MRTRKNLNIDYLNAFNGKPTSSWLYVNKKPLYVPQYRLAISLSSDLLSTTCDEPILLKNPYLQQKCYLLVDPNTKQTYRDAQVQICSDRIKNLFQLDMEDENSWFTITPTLEHSTGPAVLGPKDVTPVSRRAFGGAGDAAIHTRA